MQGKTAKIICAGCAVGVLAASVSVLGGYVASSKAVKRAAEGDSLPAKDRGAQNGRDETEETAPAKPEPTATPAMEPAEKVPSTGSGRRREKPVFVFGRAKLVGLGTLASLQKKK